MGVVFVSLCDEKRNKAQVKKEGREGGREREEEKEEK